MLNLKQLDVISCKRWKMHLNYRSLSRCTLIKLYLGGHFCSSYPKAKARIINRSIIVYATACRLYPSYPSLHSHTSLLLPHPYAPTLTYNCLYWPEECQQINTKHLKKWQTLLPQQTDNKSYLHLKPMTDVASK